MRDLNFEDLSADSEKFKVSDLDSYAKSYCEFIKYFNELDTIDSHHLVIGSHFVYGWMPTILNLDLSEIDQILLHLNEAKSGKILSVSELVVLKKCLNNSMVGTSKLLHFINPDIYAIWDSWIHRYLKGSKSSYGIDNPTCYLNYLTSLNEVIQHKNFQIIQFNIQRNYLYPISKKRAIEVLLFETARNSNKGENENKTRVVI